VRRSLNSVAQTTDHAVWVPAFAGTTLRDGRYALHLRLAEPPENLQHSRSHKKGPIVKIVDLSRELYHRTPSYPGHPPIIHGVWKTHEESFADSGNVHGLSSMFLSMADHGGTHIDAPKHFDKRGQPIDQYPLEKCIVPGICIDLRHIAPRAEIAPADLEAAVKKTGVPVPKGGTVLLCTGHHERTFRARNMRPTIPASMLPPPNGWPARAWCISASIRCGPGPTAR
jgi:Putative cyclase